MPVPISAVRSSIYAHFLSAAPAQAVLATVNLAPLAAGGRLSFSAEEAPRPDDSSFWLRVVVRHTSREQESLGAPGNRVFRSEAIVYSQAFVPLQSVGGPVPSVDALLDAFKAIWAPGYIDIEDTSVTPTVSYGRISVYAASVREDPPEGPWLAATSETPISYDERA